MAGYSLNGLDLYKVKLEVPRTGVITCDVATSGDDPLDLMLAGEPATLEFGGLTFSLVVSRGGDAWSSNIVRLVGGTGDLSNAVEASGWQVASYVSIVQTILAQVGMQLSSTVTPGTCPPLYTVAPFWTVRAEAASKALTRVTMKLGALSGTGIVWRTLADGSVWVGLDTFPAQVETSTYTRDDLGQQPERGREKWSVIPPELLPGTTFNEKPVSCVTYDLYPDPKDPSRTSQKLDAWVQYEDSFTPPPYSRNIQPWAALVKSLSAGFDFFVPRPALVQAQNAATLALDLTFEDEDYGQLTGVPMKFGTPATSAYQLLGARVYVAWENGDPSAPYVCGYDGEQPGPVPTPTNPFNLGGLARVGDMVVAPEASPIGAILAAFGYPPSFIFLGIPYYLVGPIFNGSPYTQMSGAAYPPIPP